MRQDRAFQELRTISFETDINLFAEGSCLVKFGNTQIMCTASIIDKVPPWLKNSGKGWITAEYGMLPRSTNKRIDREAIKGRQSGRTQEIQRLIGRSLRAVVNLDNIGENELSNLEKREDGKFEIIDVKLDNRKTKSLDKNSKNINDENKDSKKIDLISENLKNQTQAKEDKITFVKKINDTIKYFLLMT